MPTQSELLGVIKARVLSGALTREQAIPLIERAQKYTEPAPPVAPQPPQEFTEPLDRRAEQDFAPTPLDLRDTGSVATDVARNLAVNTPRIAGNFVKGVARMGYDTVLHPVDTLGGMGRLAIGAYNKVAPEGLQLQGQDQANEEFNAAIASRFGAPGQSPGDRFETAARTFAMHPETLPADALMVGAPLAAKAPAPRGVMPAGSVLPPEGMSIAPRPPMPTVRSRIGKAAEKTYAGTVRWESTPEGKAVREKATPTLMRDEIAPASDAGMLKYSERVNRLIDAVTAHVKHALGKDASVAVEDMVGPLRAYIEELRMGPNAGDVPKIEARINDILNSPAVKDGRMPIDLAQRWKKELYARAERQFRQGSDPSLHTAAEADVRVSLGLKDAIERAVEPVSPEKATPIKKLNAELGDLLSAQKALVRTNQAYEGAKPIYRPLRARVLEGPVVQKVASKVRKMATGEGPQEVVAPDVLGKLPGAREISIYEANKAAAAVEPQRAAAEQQAWKDEQLRKATPVAKNAEEAAALQAGKDTLRENLLEPERLRAAAEQEAWKKTGGLSPLEAQAEAARKSAEAASKLKNAAEVTDLSRQRQQTAEKGGATTGIEALRGRNAVEAAADQMMWNIEKKRWERVTSPTLVEGQKNLARGKESLIPGERPPTKRPPGTSPGGPGRAELLKMAKEAGLTGAQTMTNDAITRLLLEKQFGPGPTNAPTTLPRKAPAGRAGRPAGDFTADVDYSAIEAANKTARSAGAVGNRAITPRYVAETVKPGETVLNFGAGKPDKATGRYAHSDVVRNAGAEVSEYDFGKNAIGDTGKKKYDTVFASNVLNTQGSRVMLLQTLGDIKSATNGRAVFNYPESPRYSNLTATEIEEAVAQVFGNRPVRVGGTKNAPIWEVRPATRATPTATNSSADALGAEVLKRAEAKNPGVTRR